MAHRRLMQWRKQIRRWLLDWLERDNPAYRQRIFNDLPKLQQIIRKGDVLLVEGRSEMSRLIKIFSNSHWSHVAMYVGDALIHPEHPDRRHYLSVYGNQAKHLLVEAYTGQGVTVAPLYYYRDYNIRICRPYGIRSEDLNSVVENVIRHIGRHYDDQNVKDLALMLLSSIFNSRRQTSHRECLGSCDEFQVICSGMIARAFQKVGYPIVPALNPLPAGQRSRTLNPYGAKLLMRHYSQILPRDFDLSPNFEVIKFNLVGEKFDYRTMWQEKSMTDDRKSFAPPAPWIQYPQTEPWWGGWRQGNGEAWLLTDWLPFWQNISPKERTQYLMDNPPPTEDWREYLENHWCKK